MTFSVVGGTKVDDIAELVVYLALKELGGKATLSRVRTKLDEILNRGLRKLVDLGAVKAVNGVLEVLDEGRLPSLSGASESIEERVRTTYSIEESTPVRDPLRMVRELRGKYKLIVDEEAVYIVVSAFLNGRPVLFEGPPGTGKTEIGYALLSLWAGKPAFILPCSETYDEYRVIGDFHPLMALHYGFNEASFVPRPLLAALILGAGVLVDEVRRSNEEFQNLLLDIIDKRRIVVPELKRVFYAKDEGFQVIMTSNPEDIAQNELSDAFLRRVIRIEFNYPGKREEAQILKVRLGSDYELLPEDLVSRMLDVINVLRAKASHKPGIADTVLWAQMSVSLAKLRGHSKVTLTDIVDAGYHVLCKRPEDAGIAQEVLEKLLGGFSGR